MNGSVNWRSLPSIVELDDTAEGGAVLLVIHVMPTQLRRREQT